MAQLKDPSALRIVSVAVVNETPGSRREIGIDQLGAEISRMASPRLRAATKNNR